MKAWGGRFAAEPDANAADFGRSIEVDVELAREDIAGSLAHVEGLTFSKEQLRFNRLVADELAQATYDGIWFSALHRDLREYVHSSQRVVNGQVRMRLETGNAYVVGRRSDDSLYDRTLATYDSDDAYDHAASVGFIKIFGLPLRTEAARHDSAWTWTEPMLGELPVEVADAKADATV